MAFILTEAERAILAALVKNEADDPEGAWSWFHHSILGAVKAVGRDELEADAICRNLRKRKLLAGNGSGKWASYYLTDKGRAALEAA